jgi:hypothetical protein
MRCLTCPVWCRTYVRLALHGKLRSHQELLVVQRLIRHGRTDKEIAVQTGIPRRTICDWRLGKRQINRLSGTFCDYRCLETHNFGHLPPRPYAYLLGIYLGDGYISRTHRGVYCIRITLDAAYPGVIDECCTALEAIFPSKTARRGKRRHSRCVDVSMWSKHWPCFIPQHGPGRKHQRSIQLAPWQKKIVATNRKLFLRGLIHSDGTRIIATERKGAYMRRAPRYAFSNRSEDIKRLFCESCDVLGIRWTQPSDRQIAIYRKTSVALLDEFVGPKR